MALPTIEELDALDLSQPPASAPPTQLLSPQDLDQIDLTPAPRFVRPNDRIPQISDVTGGGPRVPVSAGSAPFLEDLDEGPLKTALGVGRFVGHAVGQGGKLMEATAGDIASIPSDIAGYTKPLENIKAFSENPEADLPIEQRANQPGAVGRFAMKSGLGVFKMEPQLAASFGLGALGAPSAIAASVPMFVTDKGEFDPVGATIAAGLPGVNRFGENLVAGALSKIPISKVVVQELAGSGGQLRGTVIQKLGGMTISNDEFRKFLEAGGGLMAANAYLLAAQAPNIAQLPPGARKQAVLDIVAQNIAPSLLGFIRPGVSKMLEGMTELQKQFNEQFPGGRMPAAPLGSQLTTGAEPTPEGVQPNAPSPIEQPGSVPPERGGALQQQQIQAAGQTPEPGTDTGNRLPSPAGQPPQGPVSAPVAPIAPPIPGGGISPPIPAPEGAIPPAAAKPIQPAVQPAAGVSPGGGAVGPASKIEAVRNFKQDDAEGIPNIFPAFKTKDGSQITVSIDHEPRVKEGDPRYFDDAGFWFPFSEKSSVKDILMSDEPSGAINANAEALLDASEHGRTGLFISIRDLDLAGGDYKKALESKLGALTGMKAPKPSGRSIRPKGETKPTIPITPLQSQTKLTISDLDSMLKQANAEKMPPDLIKYLNDVQDVYRLEKTIRDIEKNHESKINDARRADFKRGEFGNHSSYEAASAAMNKETAKYRELLADVKQRFAGEGSPGIIRDVGDLLSLSIPTLRPELNHWQVPIAKLTRFMEETTTEDVTKAPKIATEVAKPETKAPVPATKAPKVETLSPQDWETLRAIDARLVHADSIGLAVGGIKQAVMDYKSGDAAKVAQLPPVTDTLRALNMTIANHEWNNDPIYQLIFADEDGQKKAARLRKMAGEQGLSVKEMQEKVESYLVRVADRVARDGTLSPDQRFQKLVQIYDRQPTLSARTSTSVADQAYSTPMPMAYALSWMAGVNPHTRVYEPTAGNAMLMIGSNLAESHANEINPERAKSLKEFGVGNVSTEDASKEPPGINYPVVLMNPPFGSTPNVNYNGFGIKKLEHIIALRAIEGMDQDGTAAMILGAKMKEGPETAKGAEWVFENYLYGHYNVVANFEVSGDLYAKQGAKWPVRIIVIHGVRTPPVVADLAPKNVVRYENWDQVWAAAKAVHDAITARRQGVVPGGQAGLPLPLPGEPALRPGEPAELAGGNLPAPATGGRPGGIGGRQPTLGSQPPAGGAKLPPEQAPGRPQVPGVPAEQPGAGGIAPPGMEVGPAGNAGATPDAGVGSTPPGTVAKPGVVPEPTSVDRPAGDLAGMSEAELDSLLDQAASAPKQTPIAQGRPKTVSKQPSASKQAAKTAPKQPKTLTAADIAAEAAKSGVTGAGDALKGLHDLFGGAGTSALGPIFNEQTYAKAKPHFQEAYDQFKKAGKSLKEFFQFIFQKFGQKVRDYLKRFVQDLQKEPPREEAAPDPEPVAIPRPKPNEFQVEYVPHSKGTPFGTLMPKNIAEGMINSLNALEAKHGPVDDYVAGSLNMSVPELHQVMAADQIDNVATAIDQIQSGGALICGLETGIGKGRIAASIIRFGMLQGMIPVFFTKDPKLFSDMYGDLGDIHTKITPLIFGDPGKASIVDPKTGSVVVRAPGKEVQDREMARIQESGMAGAGYNAIFSTYSQINNRNARQAFLEQLAQNNPVMVVMDEAHEAAGDSETSMQAAFFSGGRVKRGSGPTQVQITVPGLLNSPGTRQGQGGVLYLSATYAKRPENMPVYYRTALSKAAQKFDQIVEAMKKGGVALQQAVSEALSKAGQYTRLERDFSGVTYDMKRVAVKDTAKLRDHIDQVTDVLSQIVQFSEAIRSRVQGSTAMSGNATDMADFAAIVHNQVGQLLLAAKADAVIQEAIDAKAKGEKPLIALMNTMESFLGHYVEDRGIAPGMPIKLRWNELTKFALSRTLRSKTKNPDGSVTVGIVNPDDYGLGPLYRSIEAAADAIESKFPVSPIDYIIQKLNAAGVKMAELTGRESGIDYTNIDEGEGFYKRFQKANKNKVVNGFNNGVYDGMLLNASGSTGLSAHASLKTGSDHRPRHMVIAQPSLDINVFVQTLGRIKRTGMLLLGKGEDGQPYGAKYTHLVLPLQAEMRPAAKAARKMKSLNANTTAEADNAIKIESEDLFNRYGDRVVAEYLDAHPDIQRMLGLDIETNDDGSVEAPRDLASKFTGRMALMPDDSQKTAYDEILPAYRALIEQLKATGEYDLEIVVHKDWDGILKDDAQLAAGTDESNIFTAGTRLQKWEVKDTRHTPTGAEMVREFHHKTGGEEKLMAQWAQVQSAGDKKMADLQRRIEEEQAKWNADEARLSDLTEAEKTAHGVEGMRLAQMTGALAPMTARWEAAKNMADSILQRAGQIVEVSNDETGDVLDGMLVDVKFPTSRYSPSAFRLKFMLHAPGGVAYITGAEFGSGRWHVDLSDKEPEDLKGGNLGARYERFLVTGNPIRGYVATGGRGKMTRFTSSEGQIVTGLLMPRNWGPAQLANDPRLDLVNGTAAAHFLTNYGLQGRTPTPIEAANIVRITREGYGSHTYTVSTSSARRTGGSIFLDRPLVGITGDFTKRGNRMVADVDESDLDKVTNRIMQITGQPFRPVGQANVLMPQVLESNHRGSRQGSLTQEGLATPVPQALLRGPVKARSIGELKAAVNAPDSGFPAEAVALCNEFLKLPKAEALEGVTFTIADALDNGYQGSTLGNDIAFARSASPETPVHEMMHILWDLESDEVQTEAERLRVETLNQVIKEAGDNGNLIRAAAATDLRDRPTTGGDDYLARRYPSAVRNELYPLSSAEEFYANMGSKHFQKKVGSIVPGFWDRVKQFMRDIIAAFRSLFKRKQSREAFFDKVLSGDFKPTLREAVEKSRQASLGPADMERRQEDIEEGLARKGMKPTEVFGTTDFVLDRPEMTPDELAKSLGKARAMAAAAGFQTTVMTANHPYTNQPNQFLVFDPTGFDMNAEGKKLLDLLKAELSQVGQPGRHPVELSAIIGAVRANFHMAAMGIQSAFADIDPPLRQELFRAAQSPVSYWGMMLGAQAQWKPDLSFASLNIDVALYPYLYDSMGGPEVQAIIERILGGFRDQLSEKDIETVLAGHPGGAEVVDKAIALARRDPGSRVYQMLQRLLKPKFKKTLSMLEGDARANETVAYVLEELKKEGVEPKPSPNKPLTPIQRLVLMASPETAEKIDKAAQVALYWAERNAGIKAAIAAAPDEATRTELQGRFDAGEEPDPDMITRGLSTPEYAHWQVFKEIMGNYDPVTVKLAQDLIRSDFRGTRFAPPKERLVDTRLNLEALAKSKDAEVNRVLQAYLSNIGSAINMATLDAATKQRILSIIEAEVVKQLESARERVRAPLFQPPKNRLATPTAEQRLGQIINAQVFSDPRLDIPEMVSAVAAKGAFQRAMPTVAQLIRMALETPFYRRDELLQNLANNLVEHYGVSPEQADVAKSVIGEALRQKMDGAVPKAIESAKRSLTPREIEVIKPSKTLWQKLEQLFNSGAGLDTSAILDDIARRLGRPSPSVNDKAKLRDLAEREMRMRELTPAQKLEAGGDPSAILKAQAEIESETLEARAKLMRQMGALWAKFTKPISWRHYWANRQNNVAALNEYETANLLLKTGFAAWRLPTHILTQLAWHIPTRLAGIVWRDFERDLARGNPTHLWRDVAQRLRDGYGGAFSAIRPAMRSFAAAMAGRSEGRNVDRLMTGIAAFDRLELAVKEHWDKGDYGQAAALYIAWLPNFALRFVNAVDNFQGTPVEQEEMRLQARTQMREDGRTEPDILANMGRIFYGKNQKLEAAILQTRAHFAEKGIQASEAQIVESAWNLIRTWQYEEMRAMGMPADDFMTRNQFLRRVQSWQERTDTGLGGVVASVGRGISAAGSELGVALPFTRFTNAIGTGINYQLLQTPLAALGLATFRIPGVTKSKQGSQWNRTEEDRYQNRVKWIAGSLIGALIAELVMQGVLRVFVTLSKDKEERAIQEAQGHRHGTVEFVINDHEFIAFSLTVGPMALFAPYLAAAGAIVYLQKQREAAQAKLNAEAAKLGVEPGKIRPISGEDWMGVAASSFFGSLMGNKAFSGIQQSITGPGGILSLPKAVSSTVTAIVPGLPGYQELMRAGGVDIDPKLATIADFAVPLPTSRARAVNMLGDPVGVPDKLQQFIQTLTAGTYPGIVDSNTLKSNAAYAALFDSGYRPPAISPDHAYVVNGTFRPLSDKELEDYTVRRAEGLKENLSGLALSADPVEAQKEARAAYHVANTAALQSIGVDTAAKSESAQLASALPATPASKFVPPGAPTSARLSGGAGTARSSGVRGARPLRSVRGGAGLSRPPSVRGPSLRRGVGGRIQTGRISTGAPSVRSLRPRRG